ncbi:MAG TPA: BadF/BadG/BcrA/BcrD ATPase family protein [Fimbriimonadaceae bacterium]|nr:BadF/BadG/BcrA/BcrD ATPase family protein [Fimbriimonadaceae bacterium]HRJ97813.1 BadF/BadG/BcrA/BcrD ATPase family protein [Fimbriimonadaceae bacterium]
MPVLLGIDAGGSKTRALAADESGSRVAAGEGGPANLATLTPTAIREALAEATRNLPSPTSVCGCFAGLVSDRQASIARSILADLFPAARCDVRPDFHAALASSPAGTTCCVVAGTGSVVSSFVRGQVVRSGGGGPLLGDQGSAFAIGRRAVQALLAGRPVGPAVTAHLEAELGARGPTEVVGAIMGSSFPAAVTARLATPVAEDALAGDAEAEWIIAHEMGLLAELTLDHLRRFHAEIEEPRISLSGGLWRASPVFVKEFSSAVTQGWKGDTEGTDAARCIIEESRLPPVSGALELARRLHDEHRSP